MEHMPPFFKINVPPANPRRLGFHCTEQRFATGARRRTTSTPPTRAAVIYLFRDDMKMPGTHISLTFCAMLGSSKTRGGMMVNDLQSGSCANKKKKEKEGAVPDTVGSTVLAEPRGDSHAQTAGHLALCGGGVSQGQQVGQLGFCLSERDGLLEELQALL